MSEPTPTIDSVERRPVALVVDSTSDVPPALAASLGITVVPLTVHFGERVFRDGVEITPAAFLAELQAATVTPTTSQPPVVAFQSVFAELLAAGKDVVCLTIAAPLSGTHNAARLAAEAVDPGGARIELIDTGTVSAHVAVAAVAAARVATAGGSRAEVVARARSVLARGQIYVVLDTLEYLQRGGRIGKAQALVGSLLAIKPIVTVENGAVTPLERVRTWRKALERIAELGRARAPLESLAVYHAGNPDDADLVASRLADLVPSDRVLRGEIGPVVATYGGPGLVGIVPVRAE